jgi:hypothetical protein
MPIVSEVDAQRLARAVLTDLRLYSAKSVPAGQDLRSALAGEIAEGRALFQARVAPELHSIFERELAAFDLTPPPPLASSRGLLMVGVAIFVLVAAVAGWVLARGPG